MEAKESDVIVSASVPADASLPPAEGINFCHFTVVGPEVQMLVGCVNLIQLHDAKKRGGPSTITPQITHRFSMSTMGFAQLRAALNEIAGSVQEPKGIVVGAQADRR